MFCCSMLSDSVRLLGRFGYFWSTVGRCFDDLGRFRCFLNVFVDSSEGFPVRLYFDASDLILILPILFRLLEAFVVEHELGVSFFNVGSL